MMEGILPGEALKFRAARCESNLEDQENPRENRPDQDPTDAQTRSQQVPPHPDRKGRSNSRSGQRHEASQPPRPETEWPRIEGEEARLAREARLAAVLEWRQQNLIQQLRLKFAMPPIPSTQSRRDGEARRIAFLRHPIATGSVRRAFRYSDWRIRLLTWWTFLECDCGMFYRRVLRRFLRLCKGARRG